MYNWYYFLLKYFLEFTIDAIWASSFLYWKDFNCEFSFLSRHRAVQVIFRAFYLSSSVLSYLVPHIFAVLASLKSDLCSSKFSETTGLLAFPFPVLHPGNTRQSLGGKCVTYLLCFPSFRNDCPVLPIAQGLKTIVSCILSSFLKL